MPILPNFNLLKLIIFSYLTEFIISIRNFLADLFLIKLLINNYYGGEI